MLAAARAGSRAVEWVDPTLDLDVDLSSSSVSIATMLVIKPKRGSSAAADSPLAQGARSSVGSEVYVAVDVKVIVEDKIEHFRNGFIDTASIGVRIRLRLTMLPVRDDHEARA